MTRILTAIALPDPPTNIDFIVVCASADGLSWSDRETLAREANKDADADLLHDLEIAGLY